MLKTLFNRKLIPSLLIAMSLSAFLSAEPFRVSKLHVVEIEQDPNFTVTEKLGLNDSIAIYLPDIDKNDYSFINGIEIKMEIPEQTAIWRDCCACYVYQNIKPKPVKGQIDFTGNKVFFSVLPGKLSWVLQIPVKNDVKFKTNQYTTTADTAPDTSCGFVFVRLQPIMKGVPDEVLDSEITFNIKPLLEDKGMLDINFILPESLNMDYEQVMEQILFFLDDNIYQMEHYHNGFLLDTGIHNLSIVTNDFRTEVRTVRIDQAKHTKLEIALKSIEPTLIISAPEGSSVYLDDVQISNFGKEIIITEGEHKIRCSFGSYEIIRSITAVKGKTYKANLSVDLDFSEE